MSLSIYNSKDNSAGISIKNTQSGLKNDNHWHLFNFLQMAGNALCLNVKYQNVSVHNTISNI